MQCPWHCPRLTGRRGQCTTCPPPCHMPPGRDAAAAAQTPYLSAAPEPQVWTSVGMRVRRSPSFSLRYVPGSCSSPIVLAPSLGMRTWGRSVRLPSSCTPHRYQPPIADQLTWVHRPGGVLSMRHGRTCTRVPGRCSKRGVEVLSRHGLAEVARAIGVAHVRPGEYFHPATYKKRQPACMMHHASTLLHDASPCAHSAAGHRCCRRLAEVGWRWQFPRAAAPARHRLHLLAEPGPPPTA